MAARNGLTVVVQELLAKGASVLAVDENGKFQSIFLFILVLYFGLLGYIRKFLIIIPVIDCLLMIE